MEMCAGMNRHNDQLRTQVAHLLQETLYKASISLIPTHMICDLYQYLMQ